MRSLNKGLSPVVTARVPLPLVHKVEEHRSKLGLTWSAFLREALRVAVGERCCMTPWVVDPFSTGACTCNPRKGGTA